MKFIYQFVFLLCCNLTTKACIFLVLRDVTYKFVPDIELCTVQQVRSKHKQSPDTGSKCSLAILSKSLNTSHRVLYRSPQPLDKALKTSLKVFTPLLKTFLNSRLGFSLPLPQNFHRSIENLRSATNPYLPFIHFEPT
jgi:hypothetical protein